MKKQELDLIKEIVDNEINNKETTDLINIKNYIDKQILSLQDEENYDILSLDLISFMDKYLTIKGTRFNRYSVYAAVRKITNKFELKLSDVVGIGSEKLLEYYHIGPDTINMLENALNIFGYSLDEKLDQKEAKKLKVYKEKNNKDAN